MLKMKKRIIKVLVSMINEFVKRYLKNALFRLSRIIDYPLAPPDSIQLNLLYRCNLTCRMCKMNTRDARNELSLEVLKKLANEAQAMGTKEVLILGGEPFLRADLYDLIRHVNANKMISIVVTNGTLLTDENLDKIKESGLSNIVVSLDASNDKTMSAIRGNGVFDKIISSIERFQRFQEKNKEFHAILSNCVTIMNQNIKDLYDIVMFSKKNGFYSVIFQPVIFDNTNQVKEEAAFDTRIPPENMDLMEDSINKIIEFKKSGIRNYEFIINSIKNLELIKKYFKGTLKRKERQCYVGFNRFQATQDLKAYFCVPLGDSGESSFGNIQSDNIKNIWYSAQAKKYRKEARKRKCCCMQRCAFREDFEVTESISEKISVFGFIKSIRRSIDIVEHRSR